MSIAWLIAAGALLPLPAWAWRLLRGPGALDRIFAVQQALQCLAVSTAASAVALGGWDWVEILLLLLGLGLALSVMALKLVRYRSLQPRMVLGAREPGGDRNG